MWIEQGLKLLKISSCFLLLFSYGTAYFQHSWAAYFGLINGNQFHISVSTLALLMAFFCQISILFYFIGSGRWIKDQAFSAHATHPENAKKIWAIFQEANTLKFPTMPLVSLCLILGLLTFILGGAQHVSASPVWLHPLLATFLTIFHCLLVFVSFKKLRKNVLLLDSVSDLIVETNS